MKHNELPTKYTDIYTIYAYSLLIFLVYFLWCLLFFPITLAQFLNEIMTLLRFCSWVTEPPWTNVTPTTLSSWLSEWRSLESNPPGRSWGDRWDGENISGKMSVSKFWTQQKPMMKIVAVCSSSYYSPIPKHLFLLIGGVMCFHDVAVVCSCSYCFLLKHLKPTNPPLDLFGGFGCGLKRQENNNTIYMICETMNRKKNGASSTLDLYLGFHRIKPRICQPSLGCDSSDLHWMGDDTTKSWPQAEFRGRILTDSHLL